MFDDLTLARIQVASKDAARCAAREFNGIDVDDIEGHILERVCRSPHRFERNIENTNWLWSAFYAEAIAYCNKQVRDFMYYSDEYYYTPGEVREILERAYDRDIGDDEYIYINDATISLIDLQVAFNKLNLRDRDLITRKLQYKEKLDATERRAYYRATEHLSAVLNGTITENSKARVNHEGPGARKVLSNAQAINQTRSSSDG